MSDDIDTFVAATKTSDTDGSVVPKPTGRKFWAYSIGVCCASACTSLDDTEAEITMNKYHPTGIQTRWAISKDKTFSGGEPHPSPCPDDSSCRHILFEC